MSLLAMSFGDRFCFSRKGRLRGGGWVPVMAMKFLFEKFVSFYGLQFPFQGQLFG